MKNVAEDGHCGEPVRGQAFEAHGEPGRAGSAACDENGCGKNTFSNMHGIKTPSPYGGAPPEETGQYAAAFPLPLRAESDDPVSVWTDCRWADPW